MLQQITPCPFTISARNVRLALYINPRISLIPVLLSYANPLPPPPPPPSISPFSLLLDLTGRCCNPPSPVITDLRGGGGRELKEGGGDIMTTYHMISLQPTMISPPTHPPLCINPCCIHFSLTPLPSSYCCPMQPLPPPPPPSHTSNSPFPLFSELTCGTWADADTNPTNHVLPLLT